MHVHTGLSTDAGGTRLMPRDACRFARGEQATSNTAQPLKLSRSCDFFAVTDHTDGMGRIFGTLKGAPNVMAEPHGRELNQALSQGGKAAAEAVFGMIARFARADVPAALNYQPGNPSCRSTLETVVDAAEWTWASPRPTKCCRASTPASSRSPPPGWTANDRAKFGLDLPEEIPTKTQERACTSPIRYTPEQLPAAPDN